MKDLGSKVQWVIKFQNNKPQQIQKYTNRTPIISLENNFSSPQKRGTEPSYEKERVTQDKVMESLSKLAEESKKIKDETIEKYSEANPTGSSEELLGMTTHLKRIYQLILEFVKLIKKLTNP